MTYDEIAVNNPAPCSPFSAPSPSMSFRTAGSAVVFRAFAIELTRPGAAISSNRSSMPEMNSGGITAHWIEPNCMPSICRGIEPNWLAG